MIRKGPVDVQRRACRIVRHRESPAREQVVPLARMFGPRTASSKEPGPGESVDYRRGRVNQEAEGRRLAEPRVDVHGATFGSERGELVEYFSDTSALNGKSAGTRLLGLVCCRQTNNPTQEPECSLRR